LDPGPSPKVGLSFLGLVLRLLKCSIRTHVLSFWVPTNFHFFSGFCALVNKRCKKNAWGPWLWKLRQLWSSGLEGITYFAHVVLWSEKPSSWKTLQPITLKYSWHSSVTNSLHITRQFRTFSWYKRLTKCQPPSKGSNQISQFQKDLTILLQTPPKKLKWESCEHPGKEIKEYWMH
jgi:hypothetical protein